jgi:hypothetical protein
MEKYGSVPARRTGSQNPANLLYWDQLDEVADLMAVVVKKPNALVGGDPTRYGCVGEDLERYYTLTKEVSAVLGARGIASDDCISFLSGVAIPDKLHVAAEAVGSWSAYVVTQALNATYASQVQKELLKLRTESAGFSEVTHAHTSNKKMLVDDLRRKLLSGELNIQTVIEKQKAMTEFKLSLPQDCQLMTIPTMKTWRNVGKKRQRNKKRTRQRRPRSPRQYCEKPMELRNVYSVILCIRMGARDAVAPVLSLRGPHWVQRPLIPQKVIHSANLLGSQTSSERASAYATMEYVE